MMPADKLVFIVDDDEAVRDSLELLLESAGHAVQVFEAAHDALEACRARPPACIVTDVRMPEMDGLEFQEKLTASGIRVPVIVMTGHADVPLAVRAMTSPANLARTHSGLGPKVMPPWPDSPVAICRPCAGGPTQTDILTRGVGAWTLRS